MPTYEYACRDCGEHVEVVQSFRDDPLTTCGLCGGSLRKVFSAAGIVFKGSGYYVTDSRKPAPSGSDGAGGDGASDGKKADAPAASGKTDAKTPASSDAASKGSPGKNSGGASSKTSDAKSA